MDDPLTVFIASWGVSGLCGLAVLLRSDRRLTLRVVVASVLYTGLLGAATAMVFIETVGDRAWFAIGISMLTGLSGIKASELFLLAMRRLGVAMKAMVFDDDDHGK